MADSGGPDRPRDPGDGLSDNEGSLLALVLRRQPVTAYQLFKIYERSPVTRFNASKGSLYPLIKRLRASGLLNGKPKDGSARRADALSCTGAGEQAVKAWVLDLRPNHIVLDDPLRTKLLSLDCLTRDEQVAWIERARGLIVQRYGALAEYADTVSLPFQDLVRRSAQETLQVKLDWLGALVRDVLQAP